MPRYEYVCPKCGYKCEEFVQGFKHIQLCPKCQTAMDKEMSTPAKAIIK